MPPIALRADARVNRERVLRAAHAVFRERGLEAEMKDIADRAGVGFGTVYRNFPTKEDLVAAVVNEVIDGVVAAIDEAQALPDPILAIRRFLAHGMMMLDEYGGLMDVLGPRMPETCRARFGEANPLGRLTALVQRGIDEGILRPGLDVELVAAGLIGTIKPGLYDYLRQTRSREQVLDGILSLVLDGIRRPGGPLSPNSGARSWEDAG